ncbi:MAG: hypothetical protein RLZZ361_771, partial [Cyanobacteriota bacterium]
MPIIQKSLTKEVLLVLAGEDSFQRGLNYLSQTRVINISFDENKIQAVVKGTQKYYPEIKLKDGEIDKYNCTCPAGGFCKHLVAMGLKYLSEKTEKSIQNPKFNADINSDMSLILLGILGLYGSSLKLEEITKYYQEVSNDLRARDLISIEILEYKKLYKKMNIFNSDEWLLKLDIAHQFISRALNSKYRNQIIKVVQSQLNKTNFKTPNYIQALNYYYSRLNFYFYTNNDTAFIENAEKFEAVKGQFYGYTLIEEMSFFVGTSLDNNFTYSRFLSYKPYFRKYLIKNILARFVYQGIRTPVFNDLIKNNLLILDSKNNIELSLDALLMDLRIEELEEICTKLLNEDPSKSYINFYIASCNFFRGNHTKALEQFEHGLKEERKKTRNSQNTVTEGPAIFYILTLIIADPKKNKVKIERCIKKNNFEYCTPRMKLLQILFNYLITSDTNDFDQINNKIKIIKHQFQEDWLLIPIYYFLAYF